MGEALYRRLARRVAGFDLPHLCAGRRPCAICSPIWCGGCWRTAPIPPSYRSAADPAVPIDVVLRRPQRWIADPEHARHPHIPLPRDLFAPLRRNSAGVEFGDREALEALLAEIGAAPTDATAAPLIDGVAVAGRARDVVSPIDGRRIGSVQEGDEAIVAAAMAAAQAGFRGLGRDADRRARRHAGARRRFDRAEPRPADRAFAERRRQDARRLRIGGARGESISAAITPPRRGAALSPVALPGPTGESNELRYRGRGVFVCISPWNFPLAIFTGQIAARARRRQYGRRQARRADAADRCRSGQAPARGRRAGRRAASGAGRRRGRRRAGRRRARGRRRLHRIDGSRRARSTARSPPKTARSYRSSPRPAASMR